MNIGVEVGTVAVDQDLEEIRGTENQELDVPLAQAPREWKLKGFGKLPELLYVIADEAETMDAEAERAANAVAIALGATENGKPVLPEDVSRPARTVTVETKSVPR